jgi:hypothetical protein
MGDPFYKIKLELYKDKEKLIKRWEESMKYYRKLLAKRIEEEIK